MEGERWFWRLAPLMQKASDTGTGSHAESLWMISHDPLLQSHWKEVLNGCQLSSGGLQIEGDISNLVLWSSSRDFQWLVSGDVDQFQFWVLLVIHQTDLSERIKCFNWLNVYWQHALFKLALLKSYKWIIWNALCRQKWLNFPETEKSEDTWLQKCTILLGKKLISYKIIFF